MKDLSIWESRPASKQSYSNRKVVCGVGVNDSTFITLLRVDGKNITHPSFTCWQNVIIRCFSKKLKEYRPTYDGVSVCDEWLRYHSFHLWWSINSVDGWHLDKDILTDNRIYSPESCLFIPQWLNSFLNDHGRSRGLLPIGVTYQKANRKYRSQCNDPINGGRGYIGLYSTPEEAHLAWRNRKLEISLELKPQMDAIDLRIYPRVVTIINSKR